MLGLIRCLHDWSNNHMTIPRRTFSLVTAAICLLIWLPALGAVVKPNVVFILADDLGYGDVKCFGGKRSQIDTPHFDRLAREGMKFTDAHSIASVCVPSRVGIMTGRYAWRFGNPAPGGAWGFLGTRLSLRQHTLGTMMKGANYRTGYVGKWHLGTLMQTKDGKTQNIDNVDYTKPIKTGPAQYGFDESFILPGSLDMYPYAFVKNSRWVGEVTARKGWSAFNRVGPAAKDFEDHQVLDTFCTEAERFIAESSRKSDDAKPFFLYLALTAPHTPLSPSKKFEGKSKLGVYGDFVMETDDCVGRVLAALDRHGIAENTLVIATSDHGAASYAGRNRKATVGQLTELEKDGHYASGVFRGYKFSVYEGGFRVPFVARWPKVVRGGVTCDRLVGLHDLMATLAEIVGYKPRANEAPDSISLLPLLKDPAAAGTRTSMIFQATRGMAIRSGKWKLAFCPGSGCDDRWLIPVGHQESWQVAVKNFGRKVRNRSELSDPSFVQLFDFSHDLGEKTDLATRHPGKIKELRKLYETQVESGRSTPGKRLTNDRENIRAFPGVPPFVWQKPTKNNR
jgi:arylsulfatase A-like enzyme